MLKRAIPLFAFSILLYGCAAKVSYEPPSVSPPSESVHLPFPPTSLPDLTITDISLSESGHVMVTITNRGIGPAPCGIGSLAVYVDKDLKWRVPLGELPSQAFLQPGGTVTYATPVEVVGGHEVSAIVDRDDEIIEENESNNLLVRPLGREKTALFPPGPPSSPAEPEKPKESLLRPDIAIRNLSLNPQRKLVITMENRGNSPFPMEAGNLKVFVDGRLKGSFPMTDLSRDLFLQPNRSLVWTSSLTISGRHEVEARIDTGQEFREWQEENKGLKKRIEGLPIGPDLVIKDLGLTEDFELSIILSNAGDGELRRGATFRVRITVNDQKVSEFDHFISEPLGTNSGNQYVVDPPYGVGINGTSRVKVSIWPKSPSDDIRLENNTLERNFIIYSFKIAPQTKEEFSFSPPSRRSGDGNRIGKIKTEVRWEGGGFPLRLSLKGPKEFKRVAPVSGRTPLKLEVSLDGEPARKGKIWVASVTNLMEKRVEGNLIIQHP